MAAALSAGMEWDCHSSYCPVLPGHCCLPSIPFFMQDSGPSSSVQWALWFEALHFIFLMHLAVFGMCVFCWWWCQDSAVTWQALIEWINSCFSSWNTYQTLYFPFKNEGCFIIFTIGNKKNYDTRSLYHFTFDRSQMWFTSWNCLYPIDTENCITWYIFDWGTEVPYGFLDHSEFLISPIPTPYPNFKLLNGRHLASCSLSLPKTRYMPNMY